MTLSRAAYETNFSTSRSSMECSWKRHINRRNKAAHNRQATP